MKQNPKKKKTSRCSDKRILWLATHGGLDRIRGGITVAQLAAIKDRSGYTALHYAARFGHLREIPGGVTAEQLAKIKSASVWTWERDASDNLNNFTPIGPSVPDIAALYGHLNQIQGVTLKQLRADGGQRGCDALNWLKTLIHGNTRAPYGVDDEAVALGNNLGACPGILKYLSFEDRMHVSAVRHALKMNPTLAKRLRPEMVAAML